MPSNNWTGKGKHWDIPDHEIGTSFRRINENQWFKMQRGFLLWLAESDYGRDLLTIPKEYGKIDRIGKNFISFDSGGGQRISDFRIGAKFGNAVRYKWKEIKQAYLVYERSRFSLMGWRPSLYPVAPSFQYAYTTSTFYPDPHPETTTCDGRVQNYAGASGGTDQSTWDTLHDAAAGSSIVDDDTITNRICRSGIAGGGLVIDRGHTGFDTSSIDDTDTISAATLSYLLSTLQEDGDNDGLDYATVVKSTPASNTGLATGDFDQIGDAINNPTEMIDTGARVDMTSKSNGSWMDFVFNATGISNISKTGVSNFGHREGHDVEDSLYAGSNNTANAFLCVAAETALTTSDPKLVVVHAAGGGGTAIKDILTMGLIYPR